MDSQKQKNMNISHKFVVKELSFVNKLKEGSGYQVKPVFSKKITKIDELQYDVSIKFEIIDTQENPFPFSLKAIISLITTFGKDVELSKKELDNYLNVTSIQILFPYLRATVTGLTTAGLVNPLIIPIIDVNTFSKSLSNKEGD